jgi:hypothetical protein
MARSSAFDMQNLRDNGFKTNDRALLNRAHEIAVGYEPDAMDSNDIVRERLLEVFPDAGQPRPKDAVDEKNENVVAIADPVDLRRLPDLTGRGNWGGKKRRVRYSRQTQSKYEDALPVRWEESIIQLRDGEVQDIPYPFYRNLMAAIDIRFTTSIIHDTTPNSVPGAKMVQTDTRILPKYNVADLGDTPGTEHLPEDYGDLFRRIARKTNMLKGVTRAMLLKVNTTLFGTTPISELAHVSDQDIRLKIAVSLGPEFEQMMADELYGTAVA